ncbi:hypothetical protein OS493_004427 [Desmophyllum pertusum]|uniref:Uncharacterized protein n=1 Tax=Desmophyllum pertusum TaxID=174260 RepID=A0A9W9ZU02_9CNID|nr:hypothetical protein OS493_004427 [Desmophyllum pertusum]
MASINTWKILQPIFRVKLQQRYLSVIRKTDKLTGYHTRTLDPKNGKKLTTEGFEKKEICPYYSITGNKLTTGTSRVKDEFSAWVKSGLECQTVEELPCLNQVVIGTAEKTGRKDSTKTKESLCGILFNCYVLCLFIFGSNVLEA